MFSIRKEKNRPSQHGLTDHRPDNAFHPRMETLEGRVLPSVTLLSFNLPAFVVIREPSFNFAINIHIDFAPSAYGFSGAPASPSAALGDTSSLAARLGNGGQSAATQTVDNATSSATSQQSSALASVARGNAVPTAALSELAFLSSLTNEPLVTPARPVVVKPTLPEQISLSNGSTASADQLPAVNNVALPATNNTLTLETRLAKPQPAVQAIVNRMEFMGSAVTVADKVVQDENTAKPSAPQLQPVNPPPPDMDDMEPIDAFAGQSLRQTALVANDASMPEGMDLGALWDQVSEEPPILTPELATEVAALAVFAGGIGLPGEVAAQRGAKSQGVVIGAKKSTSQP
jgi:hypothetical protein